MAKKRPQTTPPTQWLPTGPVDVKDPAPSKKRAARPGREKKTAPKPARPRGRPKKTEIVAMDANAGALIPSRHRHSLVAWFNLYMGIEAGEPEGNTFKAKAADLSRFASYFSQVTGTDDPDRWTRSISTGFVKHLLKTRSQRTGRRLAPSTVNRALATLRNTARWIHHQRPFVAGYPLERVQDIKTPEPSWPGLSDVEVTRLKSAAEQLLHLSTRANQTALRDHAMLLTLLGTALRISELLSLDFEQYQGKHFLNVKRKGSNVTDRVFVPQDAREALGRYIGRVRGDRPGPLIQSKTGRRLAPQNVADALAKIASQANAKLRKREHLELSPHVLRHTALRKMAEKKGIRYAQQMAGHASNKYIWRYVQPSSAEMEEAIDELFE